MSTKGKFTVIYVTPKGDLDSLRMLKANETLGNRLRRCWNAFGRGWNPSRYFAFWHSGAWHVYRGDSAAASREDQVRLKAPNRAAAEMWMLHRAKNHSAV